MPGTTPVQALPFPYINEAATPVSVQNLANAVDTKLSSLDTTRTAVLKRDFGKAYQSGSQSVAVGTLIVLTYDTEIFDNNGIVNLGVNNDRITVAKTGLYHISGSVRVQSTSEATNAEVAIQINGTTQVRSKTVEPTGASGSRQMYVVSAYRLVATDYVRLRVLWNGGAGPLNFTTATLAVRLVALG